MVRRKKNPLPRKNRLRAEADRGRGLRPRVVVVDEDGVEVGVAQDRLEAVEGDDADPVVEAGAAREVLLRG